MGTFFTGIEIFPFPQNVPWLHWRAMCDVKELFSPQRQRLLHGAPQEPEPPGPLLGAPHVATWRAFPDPAVKQQLQEKAMETMERLQNCFSALQLCHRDISGSRHSLRQCRNLLESHQASSLAICELLTEWADLGAIALARPAGAAGRCRGRRPRCFFCRERRALEEKFRAWSSLPGDAEDVNESAVLADVSSTCSSSSEEVYRAEEVAAFDVHHPVVSAVQPRARPTMVQRRKTSRERGQKLFKHRSGPVGRDGRATWYATHTVDPPRSVGVPAEPEAASPSLTLPAERLQAQAVPSVESPDKAAAATTPAAEAATVLRPKPQELLEDAELEPYASAAARFRAEMEFLDMSSFPASPEVKFRRRSSEARLPYDKTRPLGLVIDIEAEVVGPPAPPPSTSHSMLLHTHLEAKDPLKGWKQLLVKTGLMARRARRSSCIKLMVLRGWRSCCARPSRPLGAGGSAVASALAVHQPSMAARVSGGGRAKIPRPPVLGGLDVEAVGSIESTVGLAAIC
eukprot:s816_g6.t1